MNVLSCDLAAKVRQAYPFEVVRHPLRGPDDRITPWSGLFRTDNGEAVGHGSVSERYVPHTTNDIACLVEASAAAFDGVTSVECGFRGGHFLVVQPAVEQRLAVYGTADSVYPRLVIRAPYGGDGSFEAGVGYYRDLCRNMARMRRVNGVTVSIRHTVGLRQRMDDLIQTFGKLRDGWAAVSAAIQQMEQREVNMVEFLRAVYGEPQEDSGRSATIHRNRTEQIFRRLTSELTRSGRPGMGSDWMVSAWSAFNAVQGYVQHDATRRGNPGQMDRIILANTDAAVARAEALAMGIAV